MWPRQYAAQILALESKEARQKALVDAMLVWLLTGEVDADQVRLAVEGE